MEMIRRANAFVYTEKTEITVLGTVSGRTTLYFSKSTKINNTLRTCKDIKVRVVTLFNRRETQTEGVHKLMRVSTVLVPGSTTFTR